MKNIETQLKSLLGEFTFIDGELLEIAKRSFFGTKELQATEFRTRDKALVLNSGVRHFYVSSEMYRDNPSMQSFRYMTVWTVAKIRPYRSKFFRDYEMDKVFLSGKTDEILIENLERELAKGTI